MTTLEHWRAAHAAFGLRCLYANLGDLREQAAILEFDINQRPADVAEALLAARPRSPDRLPLKPAARFGCCVIRMPR